MIQETTQEGRSRPSHAHDDERALDRLGHQLRVLLGPLDDAQPGCQCADDQRTKSRAAETAELQLLIETAKKELESLVPPLRTEIPPTAPIRMPPRATHRL